MKAHSVGNRFDRLTAAEIVADLFRFIFLGEQLVDMK